MTMDDVPKMPIDEFDPQERFNEEAQDLVHSIAVELGGGVDIAAALSDLYYQTGGDVTRLDGEQVESALRRFPQVRG